LISLQSAPQLDAVTVIGADEIGAHEEEDHLGSLEVLMNDRSPLLPRANLLVVPAPDDAFSLEGREMFPKLLAKSRIVGRVRNKDVEGRMHDPCS
jgi:hypothetical protein